MTIDKEVNPRFEKTYKVYKHVFPNGKVYIGITSQPLNCRWRSGKGYKNNIYLTRAIEKYGWDNVRHFVLRGDFTRDEANAKEKELIQKYNSNNPSFGYNITSGGDGQLGHSHQLSEESKKKISLMNKGRIRTPEMCAHLSQKMKGRKRSLESIAKSAAGHIGLKHTEDTRKKMSESAKKAQQGEGNGFYGHIHSEDTKLRMSQARKLYWQQKKEVVS